jgi:uncharacterized DUF497 family protein
LPIFDLRFERDEEKRLQTFADRDIDFARAARIFEAVTVEVPDARREYGEVRVLAVGRVNGRYVTVIYTDRIPSEGHGSLRRRLISARPANRKERRFYDQATHDIPPR